MTEQYFWAVFRLYFVCFFAFYGIVILQDSLLIVGRGGDTLFAGGYMF